MNDSFEFKMTLSSEEEVVVFYKTMANALKGWCGGDPNEQELLRILRDEAYRMVLELQFIEG